MTRDYDAVVIGSGVAGVTAAYEMNAAAGGGTPEPPLPRTHLPITSQPRRRNTRRE